MERQAQALMVVGLSEWDWKNSRGLRPSPRVAGGTIGFTVRFSSNAARWFTTHTPHQYSSGPTAHFYADFCEAFRGMRSLLKKLAKPALRARSGQWGQESLVETTYGMAYRTDNGNPYP